MAEVTRLPDRGGAASAVVNLPPGLVPTSISQRIVETLEDCFETGEMGIIAGPSGAGKTTTAKAWAAGRSGVLRISLDGQPVFDDKDVCWRLISALGTGCYNAPPRGSMFNAVVSRITDGFGLCIGIIVDEAQHLSFAGLEALRGIHDRTGVPVVVMGSVELWEKLFGPERTRAGKEWAPVRSRLQFRCPFGHPSAADVALMAQSWGIADRAAVEFLTTLATQLDGSLREAEGVVVKARKSAGREAVTDRVLKEVARRRGLIA